MIGTIYKKKEGHVTANKELITALKMLTDCDNFAIGIISALRNCLTHNFGLSNIPKNPRLRATEMHVFELTTQHDKPLYTLPKHQWDGIYSSKKTSGNYTQVNLFKLHDLIELSYSNLVSEINDYQIEFAISSEELYTRFTTF